MKHITSLKNPLIKDIIRLQKKSSYRKETQKFVVEGQREIRLALNAGYKFDFILIQPQIIDRDYFNNLMSDNEFENKIIEISMDVYKRLAYRESTEGIIGIANWKKHNFSVLKPPKKSIILIAENIEKPGNIGAMLRTADAAHIHAFILANPITDIYNPNIIRASLGAVFTVPIVLASTQEVIDFIKLEKIRLFAAVIDESSEVYFEQDYLGPTAFAVGSEAEGLSEAMRKAADKSVIIPMLGVVDSLNVSVSAALLCYEALRQRHNDYLDRLSFAIESEI